MCTHVFVCEIQQGGRWADIFQAPQDPLCFLIHSLLEIDTERKLSFRVENVKSLQFAKMKYKILFLIFILSLATLTNCDNGEYEGEDESDDKVEDDFTDDNDEGNSSEENIYDEKGVRFTSEDEQSFK